MYPSPPTRGCSSWKRQETNSRMPSPQRRSSATRTSRPSPPWRCPASRNWWRLSAGPPNLRRPIAATGRILRPRRSTIWWTSANSPSEPGSTSNSRSRLTPQPWNVSRRSSSKRRMKYTTLRDWRKGPKSSPREWTSSVSTAAPLFF